MSLRVTLIMSFGRQAWGETHYDIAATDPSLELARATVLANKRAALLGFDASLFAVRVSDPNNPGSTDLIRFNPAIPGQKFSISTGIGTSFLSDGCGQANDAVLVQATGQIGGHFYRSRPMLGAPPEGLIQSVNGVPDVRTDLCPGWLKNFNDYSDQLVTFGWGFRVTNHGAVFPARGLTGGGGAPIGVVVDNAFSPVVGTIVHVGGFRVHPTTRQRLAGNWRVGSLVVGPLPGTNAVLLSNSETLPAAAAYLLPGSIGAVSPAVTPYLSYDIATGATRKRGGSIDLPRGRSRTHA